MGFINLAEKSINAKLVYYGVGMGGKTTSLQAVHGVMCPRNEVQLVSINTEEDATLLFDFLPINLGMVEGFKIKIQGFTVPGQPKYKLMRKYVLSGADAVVFVVDSERSRLEENRQAFEGLLQNLSQNGIDPTKIPLILQYNKRDLDDVLSEEELDREFCTREGMASFPSVATEGQGVYEAFVHASGCLVETKVRQYGLGRGEVDPAAVADGARQKLWEIRDEIRSLNPANDRGPSTELTVLDDDVGDQPSPEVALVEPTDLPSGLELLDEVTRPAADPAAQVDEDPIDLDYELKEVVGNQKGGTEILTDEDLDLELGELNPLELDAENAIAELEDEVDESLLDKTVQSNLELARKFGDLDQYRALLERRNKELVEVAQNTVHDLNRPLTAIKMMLSTVSKGYFGELAPQVQDAIDTGLHAAGQMERLIDDLMDSSRLDHDGMSMTFGDVDLHGVIDSVVQTLQHELDEVGGVITPHRLPVIRGDEWALTKVFTNLLGNALQYAHSDRPPEIHVSATRDREAWILTVEDNGIGVPESDRERLFRRFERGSNTAGVSGTGLGLHITREIVMGHGGHVWLESEEGAGTSFHLSIPLYPVQPPHCAVSGTAEIADL